MNKDEYEKLVLYIIKPLSDKILNSKNNKLYKAVKLRKEFNDNFYKVLNEKILFTKKATIITSEIDRHKLCACLICALEEFSPYKIYKKGYCLDDLFFANELLSIYSAISFLECYNTSTKIVFPSTKYKTKSIDSYIKTLCSALYMSKNNRRLKYNILTFSNILFLLEEYSKTVITETQ